MDERCARPRRTLSDNALEARIRSSFDGQSFMRTIGAQLGEIGPGEATIVLPFHLSLGQQFGHLHQASPRP